MVYNNNYYYHCTVLLLSEGIRPDDIKKEREENLRYLHIKGAYSSQELFDHHRGIIFNRIYMSEIVFSSTFITYSFNHKWCKFFLTILLPVFS